MKQGASKLYKHLSEDYANDVVKQFGVDEQNRSPIATCSDSNKCNVTHKFWIVGPTTSSLQSMRMTLSAWVIIARLDTRFNCSP